MTDEQLQLLIAARTYADQEACLSVVNTRYSIKPDANGWQVIIEHLGINGEPVKLEDGRVDQSTVNLDKNGKVKGAMLSGYHLETGRTPTSQR